MKNTVGKGAFILIVSGIVCKFFGALFRLPLINIIGIEGIGMFQMIMSLYSLMLVFISGGITSSLSKLVSSARARGEDFKLGGFLRYAIIFSGGLGIFIGLLFFLLSSSIASMQGITNGKNCYLLFFILLPLGGLIGVYRGIIQGYENMSPTAVSQVIEQLIKFVFGLFFAFLFKERGYEAGVFGAFLGITLSEVLAFLYLFIVMCKKVNIKLNKSNVKKEFFNAVLPLSFSGAILPFTHALESLIIVSLFVKAGFSNAQATTLYGLQTGVVGAILNFPMIISISIAVAILPKISFLNSKGSIEEQKNLIKSAFNIMWFLLIPLIVGIYAVCKQIYPIIYPNAINGYLDLAVQLTLIGGVSIILASINQFLSSILQAKGYFYHSLFFNILGGVGKIFMLLIFAPVEAISIYSIALSNIVMFSIISICTLIKLGSLIKIDVFQVFLPILSSLSMFLVVKIILKYFVGIGGVILSIFSGVVIYFLMALPLTKEYGNILIKKLKRN